MEVAKNGAERDKPKLAKGRRASWGFPLSMAGSRASGRALGTVAKDGNENIVHTSMKEKRRSWRGGGASDDNEVGAAAAGRHEQVRSGAPSLSPGLQGWKRDGSNTGTAAVTDGDNNERLVPGAKGRPTAGGDEAAKFEPPSIHHQEEVGALKEDVSEGARVGAIEETRDDATVDDADPEILGKPAPIGKHQPSWDPFNATPIDEEEDFYDDWPTRKKSKRRVDPQSSAIPASGEEGHDRAMTGSSDVVPAVVDQAVGEGVSPASLSVPAEEPLSERSGSGDAIFFDAREMPGPEEVPQARAQDLQEQEWVMVDAVGDQVPRDKPGSDLGSRQQSETPHASQADSPSVRHEMGPTPPLKDPNNEQLQPHSRDLLTRESESAPALPAKDLRRHTSAELRAPRPDLAPSQVQTHTQRLSHGNLTSPSSVPATKSPSSRPSLEQRRSATTVARSADKTTSFFRKKESSRHSRSVSLGRSEQVPEVGPNESGKESRENTAKYMKPWGHGRRFSFGRTGTGEGLLEGKMQNTLDRGGPAGSDRASVDVKKSPQDATVSPKQDPSTQLGKTRMMETGMPPRETNALPQNPITSTTTTQNPMPVPEQVAVPRPRDTTQSFLPPIRRTSTFGFGFGSRAQRPRFALDDDSMEDISTSKDGGLLGVRPSSDAMMPSDTLGGAPSGESTDPASSPKDDSIRTARNGASDVALSKTNEANTTSSTPPMPAMGSLMQRGRSSYQTSPSPPPPQPQERATKDYFQKEESPAPGIGVKRPGIVPASSSEYSQVTNPTPVGGGFRGSVDMLGGRLAALAELNIPRPDTFDSQDIPDSAPTQHAIPHTDTATNEGHHTTPFAGLTTSEGYQPSLSVPANLSLQDHMPQRPSLPLNRASYESQRTRSPSATQALYAAAAVQSYEQHGNPLRQYGNPPSSAGFEQPPSSAHRYPSLFRPEQLGQPRPSDRDAGQEELPAHYYQPPIRREEALLPRQQGSEYQIAGVGPPVDEPASASSRSRRNSGFFKELGGKMSRNASRDRGHDRSDSNVTVDDVPEKKHSRRPSLFGGLSRTSTMAPEMSSSPSHSRAPSRDLRAEVLAQQYHQRPSSPLAPPGRKRSIFGGGSGSASSSRVSTPTGPKEHKPNKLSRSSTAAMMVGGSSADAREQLLGKKKRFSSLSGLFGRGHQAKASPLTEEHVPGPSSVQTTPVKAYQPSHSPGQYGVEARMPSRLSMTDSGGQRNVHSLWESQHHAFGERSTERPSSTQESQVRPRGLSGTRRRSGSNLLTTLLRRPSEQNEREGVQTVVAAEKRSPIEPEMEGNVISARAIVNVDVDARKRGPETGTNGSGEGRREPRYENTVIPGPYHLVHGDGNTVVATPYDPKGLRSQGLLRDQELRQSPYDTSTSPPVPPKDVPVHNNSYFPARNMRSTPTHQQRPLDRADVGPGHPASRHTGHPDSYPLPADAGVASPVNPAAANIAAPPLPPTLQQEAREVEDLYSATPPASRPVSSHLNSKAERNVVMSAVSYPGMEWQPGGLEEGEW